MVSEYPIHDLGRVMVSQNSIHDLLMRKAKSKNSGKDCDLSVTSLNFHRCSLTYVCTCKRTKHLQTCFEVQGSAELKRSPPSLSCKEMISRGW